MFEGFLQRAKRTYTCNITKEEQLWIITPVGETEVQKVK
jgi:hypothetical protein